MNKQIQVKIGELCELIPCEDTGILCDTCPLGNIEKKVDEIMRLIELHREEG